jgi:8-oxo-dGTP pyrophosphatase MutT (NUDIX family)
VSDESDLRAIVIEAVAARRPVDDRERAAIGVCLDALGRLDAPFDRHAGPVHVTGSGLVTGRRGVLLLEHRRLHIWVQPGGHLESGETPWDAARRESEEETGLRLAFAPGRDADGERVGLGPRLAHVDVHPSAGGHTHLDLRYDLVVGDGDDQPRPPAGESQAVAWYTWPEAIAVADPGLSGLLRHLAERAQG